MKFNLKRIALTLFFGLLIFGIGLFISLLIANQSNMKLQDALFYVGIIVLTFGAFTMMKGSPSGASLQALGSKNNYIAVENLETTKTERELTSYRKNFTKNCIVEIAFGGLSIVIGGIGLLLFCIYGVK